MLRNYGGLPWLFALSSGVWVALSSPSMAQQRDLVADLALDQVPGRPRGIPQLPPQGAWGEVVNVTSRWLVVQNHSGQQFPIPIDEVQEFLIRWPSSVDSLRPFESLIEVQGTDAGGNIIRTSHIDVFEGGDRNLVQPVYEPIGRNTPFATVINPSYSQFMESWDSITQYSLYGWIYPNTPGLTPSPGGVHLVSSVTLTEPLRVSIGGNNLAAVVPDGSGRFTVTQVTRGDSRDVRKGDYVFLLPLQSAPRGLILSQLVVYKKVSLREFNRRR